MSTAAVAISTAEHAQSYAAAGWRIWPIKPRSRRPYVPHGCAEATDDADVVAEWWKRWPWANIGALVPDGLVVVDLDPRNGCQLTPAMLPATLTVATGGGGWHLYFRHAGELRAHDPEWPGVDVVNAGRQITLPPSLHASGSRYEWSVDVAPAELPGRLADAFRREQPRIGESRVPTSPTNYMDVARRGVLNALAATAGPGNNHRPLVAACKRLHELGLTEDEALDAVAPLVPTHDPQETVRTVRSCWR